MTIQSMTGFARSDGALGDATWHWEVRSVNSRSLDLRLRLPPGYEALDPKVREGVTKRITRGSVNATLTVVRESTQQDVRLNERALEQVVALAVRVSHNIGSPPPRAETLLALKGVLEVVEEPESEEAIAARHEAMLAGLTVALDGLVAARLEEGDRLRAVIVAQLDEIERLVAGVECAPSRSVEAIRRRLSEQIARIMEAGQSLDPLRLHQEAVLIATKRRRRGRVETPEGTSRSSTRAARRARRHRPQARFPDAGVQSRSQHADAPRPATPRRRTPGLP